MLKLFSKINDPATLQTLKAAFEATLKAIESARKSTVIFMTSKPVRDSMEGMRLYISMIVFVVLSILVWAACADVDRVVRVEGRVIPAGRSQQIQHLEGGILAEISTSEGSLVKRGDLLLTIDNTTADASLNETESKIAALRLKAARLDAEIKAVSTLTFPPDLANLPMAEAEIQLFNSRRLKLAEEISVHKNTTDQRLAELKEATERRTQLKSELVIAHQRTSMVAKMAEHGAASQMELLDAQSREKNLDTQIGTSENSIPTLQAAIDAERARIATTGADYRSQAQTELVAALAEIEQQTQMLHALSDRVKRTEIKAPVDGIVNRLYVNTLGGVVKAGENLIELIPTTDQILIEASAKPRDRGYLRPGLGAEIRVSTYDVGEFGAIKGKVTEVSADSLPDAHGEPFFRVNLLVKDLSSSYNDHPIVPGMTVTADIVTGHHTVLAYLLSPLTKFIHNSFRDSR